MNKLIPLDMRPESISRRDIELMGGIYDDYKKLPQTDTRRIILDEIHLHFGPPIFKYGKVGMDPCPLIFTGRERNVPKVIKRLDRLNLATRTSIENDIISEETAYKNLRMCRETV